MEIWLPLLAGGLAWAILAGLLKFAELQSAWIVYERGEDMQWRYRCINTYWARLFEAWLELPEEKQFALVEEVMRLQVEVTRIPKLRKSWKFQEAGKLVFALYDPLVDLGKEVFGTYVPVFPEAA